MSDRAVGAPSLRGGAPTGERIGLIGFGAMGAVFGSLLASSNMPPVVFDVDERARERAKAHGLRTAESVRQLSGDCDIILVAVRTEQQTEQVLAGVARGAKPGCTVVVHGTTSPTVVRAAARQLKGRSVGLVEACPTETPEGTSAGYNVFLTGGSDADVGRVLVVLRAMSREVIRMGDIGAASLAKLLKNLVIGSERVVVAEALRVGHACGLDYRAVLDMLRDTTSPETSLLATWETVFDPAEPEPIPAPTRNLFGKDVPTLLSFARQAGVDVPLVEAVSAAGKRIDEGRRSPGEDDVVDS